jgi:hypothetical protein
MEEILASIRRIIADDQSVLESNAVSQGADARSDADIESAERERIAMLRRLRAATDAASRGAQSDDRDRRAPPPRRAPDAPPPSPATSWERAASEAVSAGARMDSDDRRAASLSAPMVSQTTSAAVLAQFEKLALSRLVDDPDRLDDLVSELLRPMLQQWLDDNLPVIVERLVRVEIERVARGGRGDVR